MGNAGKTPTQLIGMLSEQENAEIATQVYAEAAVMEQEYIRVKNAAKAMVEALLPRGTKIDVGHTSAGWTQPKARWVLDKDAWERVCREKRKLAALMTNYEAAQAAFEAAPTVLIEAQKHYQRQETPASRFFIKATLPPEKE